jgi:hypothetical protein
MLLCHEPKQHGTHIRVAAQIPYLGIKKTYSTSADKHHPPQWTDRENVTPADAPTARTEAEDITPADAPTARTEDRGRTDSTVRSLETGRHHTTHPAKRQYRQRTLHRQTHRQHGAQPRNWPAPHNTPNTDRQTDRQTCYTGRRTNHTARSLGTGMKYRQRIEDV